MSIRVYNTLTKQKEPFETVTPGKVGIYLCGPTVYKESHIGHMVGPVIFDTIKRYLTYSGYEVTWVVNITDVDDKLIGQMHERGVSMSQIAEEMTIDYLNNLRALGVDQIDQMPKATEHMDGIIRFTQTLIDKGVAYASGGDVLFDVTKDPGYGKLSNRRPEDQQGEGGDAASKKRNPGDFALWKSAKPGEPAWDSPWGKGRPGWHIECSAMSEALLGETFDIHGGGLDLVFPHHENELAQSECCHGKPMVKYWLHNGLLRKGEAAGKIGGRTDREASSGKMSRSAGAGGLADVIAAQGGERIRFFLLKTHYRSTVLYGDEGLTEAATALEAFYRYFERFQKITKQRFFNLPAPTTRSESTGETPVAHGEPLLATVQKLRGSFLEKMDDDFNTGGAIADLFDLVRELNKFADQQKLDEIADVKDPTIKTLVQATQVLRELSNILGLFRCTPAQRGGGGDSIVPKLMQLFIELRADARAKKDFATGDKIRNSLAEAGITLEDRKGGVTEWRIGGRIVNQATETATRIVGVDPGLNITGYAVIEKRLGRLAVVEAGMIRGRSRGDLAARLLEIHEGITDVIASLKPDALAIEELYSHYERPRTAILMGHARGVICLAATQAGIPLRSYSATQVKRLLTGNGRAPKSQVQQAICREFCLAAPPEPPDVADAIAIALCHHYLQRDLARTL